MDFISILFLTSFYYMPSPAHLYLESRYLDNSYSQQKKKIDIELNSCGIKEIDLFYTPGLLKRFKKAVKFRVKCIKVHCLAKILSRAVI